LTLANTNANLVRINIDEPHVPTNIRNRSLFFIGRPMLSNYLNSSISVSRPQRIKAFSRVILHARYLLNSTEDILNV